MTGLLWIVILGLSVLQDSWESARNGFEAPHDVVAVTGRYLSAHPNDAAALHFHALARREAHDLSGALAHFERAIAADRQENTVHIRALAETTARTFDPEATVEAYRRGRRQEKDLRLMPWWADQSSFWESAEEENAASDRRLRWMAVLAVILLACGVATALRRKR